jgi:MFS family permease
VCGSGHAFWTVVVFRALTGAAAAAVFPLTLAFIGDNVPYEQRRPTIGGIMAASSAAQAFSTAAGGVVATVVSWRMVRVRPICDGDTGLLTGHGYGRGKQLSLWVTTRYI